MKEGRTGQGDIVQDSLYTYVCRYRDVRLRKPMSEHFLCKQVQVSTCSESKGDSGKKSKRKHEGLE